MKNPLVIYPDQYISMPSVYCGSVDYYAKISAYGKVVIDTNRRFNKREKDSHRCSIEGPNGVQRLTVPLEKPTEWHSTRLKDVRISTHGEWWNVHWGAICAAYGRTPFFEYYEDDLKHAFNGEIEMLVQLNDYIDRFCRNALGIISNNENTIPAVDIVNTKDVEYYQIWARRYGFTPHLSALDLIFNMGNEAPLVLKEMTS